MKSVTTCLAFAVTTIIFASLVHSAENLLPNPSFEDGQAHWNFWRRFPGQADGGIVDNVSFTGEASFKVQNRGRDGANLFSDDIPCEPNAQYTLTVHAKTQGANGVRLTLWGLDNNKETISYGIGNNVSVPNNLPQFMRFRHTITTPENCRYLRAHLINNGGTVWWDAIELWKGRVEIKPVVPKRSVPSGAKSILPNSSFEEGKVGWSFWQQFPGEATSEIDHEQTHDGESSFKIVNSGRGGANLFSWSIPCKPNATYTISAYVKTKGAKGVKMTCWGLSIDERTLTHGIDGQAAIPSDLDVFARFSHTFTTPKDCVRLRAHLINNGGTVWWDAVQIEEAAQPTTYADNISVADFLSPGRTEARKYTNATLREAKTIATVRDGKRAVIYARTAKMDVAKPEERLKGAERILKEVEADLQAERIAPDFMHLDYESINAKLRKAEESAQTALVEARKKLIGRFRWFSPVVAKSNPIPGGVITSDKLASRLWVYPIITRGGYYDGYGDWSILEPFGFEAFAPFGGIGARDGKYDFSRLDEIIAINAEKGYKTDIEFSTAFAIRSLRKDFGEEIYLHTADGQWSPQGNCHQTINIWHPEVRKRTADFLTAVGEHYRDDPNVLCYELINEPSISIEKKTGSFQWERIGVGGYSKVAQEAWLKHLREKFGNVEKLNEKWASRYRSFEAIEPPVDLRPRTPESYPDPSVALLYEFQRFRMDSHSDYFRLSIGALKEGDPNHVVMPQYIAGQLSPRTDAAVDLLQMGMLDWDFFSTHDWPGGGQALQCLYAYSMNRYAKKPMWEDEFIWPHWLRKGVDQRLVRAGTERNLWRQMAWGKRGIVLFNLAFEWRGDKPDNWNNSLLNLEAGSMIPRYSAAAVKLFKDRAQPLAPIVFKTEIANQGIGILQPTSTILAGGPPGAAARESVKLCSWLMRKHWLPFSIPEECILDGREDLSHFRVLIVPYAVCVPDGLEDKLIQWVRSGGILILSGPPGVYTRGGKSSLRLLSKVFGIEKIKHERGSRWQVAKMTAPDNLKILKKDQKGLTTVWQMNYGGGKGLLSLPFIAQSRKFALLERAIASAIKLKPVDCDNEDVELILRNDSAGRSYLFAINLGVGAPAETTVRVRGEYQNVIDLTMSGGLPVPVEYVGGVTRIPLCIAAGSCAFLSLR